MLIKPKEFYKKHPNFIFPKDQDDPEIYNLRAFVQQEQISNPIEQVKTKWKVPFFSIENGPLKPVTSASQWARKDSACVEIENHCFFTAAQFLELCYQASHPFVSIDNQQLYMFNTELEECIAYPYFFDHGWIIGRFVYVKKGSEIGIRPFNPSKDKIVPGNPFAAVPQGVTP